MMLKRLKGSATEITTDKATVLFSYETPVAAFLHCAHGDYEPGLYRTGQHWSVTTTKYINQWLSSIKWPVVQADCGCENQCIEMPQWVLDSLL